MKATKLLLATAICWTGTFVGSAQEPAKEPAPKADNSAVNKRDRQEGAVTADQQKMNKADRELAQKIRRSITKDKTLSTYAKNIKVIARDGTVTLKGPVRTQAEKALVTAKAAELAGEGKVVDEVSIAPDDEKSK